MGSDLYMEQRNFRPRSNKLEWDGDDIVKYVDYFYQGYTEVYRGKLTPELEKMFKGEGLKIPQKPRPFQKNDKVSVESFDGKIKEVDDQTVQVTVKVNRKNFTCILPRSFATSSEGHY